MLKKFQIFLLFLSVFGLSYAEIPEGYYPATLNGKKERELKTAFHLLLKDHTRIGYGASGTWKVFRYSDVKSGNIVWDMYSNIVRYFTSGSTGATKEMNIEHSVPKSWWGDAADYEGTTPLTRFKYDASYDLHHLTPADADANTQKSNYPLGVVRTVSWTNGVTKVGTGYVNGMTTNVFEPADEYKGDFARMYFYFVTCYQDYSWVSLGSKMFQRNDYPTLNEYARNLLLEWSRQDPVSQKEIDRNNGVYRFQYNRNPFIDFPDLAEYIWGTKTNEAFYVGAGITNWQNGDYFIFPNSTMGISVEKSFPVEGMQIESRVSLLLDGENKNMFSLSASTLSADAVNSGTNVGITYAPQSEGLHKATLTMSANDIAPVTVEIRGISIPRSVQRIVPVGLKKEYSLNDTGVTLKLSEPVAGCTWEGNGVSGVTFVPGNAGKGTHTLKWNSPLSCGTVLVIVK
ncbi:endonuclease I family protein [Coprobacter sp.]